MPVLDQKANEVFAGKVVRKDLVRQIKVGAKIACIIICPAGKCSRCPPTC